MSSDELPQQWADRLVERGFTDRRSNRAVPSLSALAERTGIHASTLSAAMRGQRNASTRVTNLLVRELGSDVARWLGRGPALGPYDPPAEASLLTSRQRKAVTELIRAIVEQRAEVVGDERDAAPTRTAGPGPAQDLYGMAARRGTPANMPDTVTGEESQLPPEDDEPA